MHLSIEIGSWWSTAVYRAGRQQVPVTVDGHTRIPSGVYLDRGTGSLVPGTPGLAAARRNPGDYLTDPLARLYTGDTGGDVDPGAAVSVLLACIAAATGQAGTPVTALTIVTAQVWGPRARARLGRAATTAGLPEPHTVTAAAAAAALAVDSSSSGSHVYVLVCVSTDTTPVVTVLDAGNQHTELATAPVQAADTPTIDQALRTLVCERAGQVAPEQAAGPGWETAFEIHQARELLAGQPRAAVVLPDPYPPVVLDRADLATAARPHLNVLDDTITQALADADLDRQAITATVLAGIDATVTDLHTALTAAGLPPTTTVDRPDALAEAAVQLTHPHLGSSATAATARLPRSRVTVRNLAATAALAAGSVALLTQAISTAYTWTRGVTVIAIAVPTASIALAAALAAMSAFTAAQLAPTTWLTHPGPADTTTAGTLIRRAYLAAAATSLAVAGLWGLSIGVSLHYYTSGPYLRWTIITTLPIAVCAAIIAIIAPRIPAHRLTACLADLRPPILPIAVAAAGIYLLRSSYAYSFPTNLIGFRGVIAVIGAALIGFATAATATRQSMIRVGTGALLALGYAFLADPSTAPYLTVIYVIALLWWVLTVTARTLREAVPGVARIWR